ncbi:MAG: sarcosine oxidase subunit gamma family protein [Gammaproteobacteria bacterium]|nr:sarcosine oxidase subunit gamma family protein [Gammaproteobacteria bacterium]
MPDSTGFSPVKAGPLAGLPVPNGGITMEDRGFLGKVNLRGDAANGGFATAAGEVLHCALPVEPNTVTSGGDFTVFWLGPDEWQIHCPEDARHALVRGLQQALAGQHSAVVDVSDYYVVARLSGDRTLEVLSKGAPIDLHPRAFPIGTCAQTRFGHATILLHKLEENMVDLQVRWSFAEYVWCYIVDGTLEYR